MAMGDRDVLVLLVVAWYRILEAFRTQSLLQLCGRGQINFIAADTFLGWVSFKGKEKQKKNSFSVLYAKWPNDGTIRFR